MNSVLTFNRTNFMLCAEFQTVNDSIVESDEKFVFAASVGNPLDSFNNLSNYQLTILDDDGMYSCIMYTVKTIKLQL